MLTGDRVWEEPWPAADLALLERDTVEVVLQVNGKLRDRIQAPADAPREELERAGPRAAEDPGAPRRPRGRQGRRGPGQAGQLRRAVGRAPGHRRTRVRRETAGFGRLRRVVTVPAQIRHERVLTRHGRPPSLAACPSSTPASSPSTASACSRSSVLAAGTWATATARPRRPRRAAPHRGARATRGGGGRAGRPRRRARCGARACTGCAPARASTTRSRRAGGARPRADLSALNLAAELEDGRQVLVPLRVAAGGGRGRRRGGAPRRRSRACR